MKISGKIKSDHNSIEELYLSMLQFINSNNQLLVLKGTEKEAIVDLKNGTYTMRPFGTVLLELLNNSEKILRIIDCAHSTKISCIKHYDNYIYSFVEIYEKEVRRMYKKDNPNRYTPKEIKDIAISNYLGDIDGFINIFINKKKFTLLRTPYCVTVKASEFVIPFSKNVQKDTYLDIYCYNSLNDIFNVYAKLFYENNISLRQCKNCGKYFIPLHKSNETLCNNIFKNRKTCKQLSGEIKLSNDEVLSIYRTAYKRENGKKNRYRHIPNIQLKFENWNKIAKEKYTDCQRGTISKEEFSNWLDSSRDWYKD